MQPEIHKLGNPGRPIIRSVNYLTIKISQYVDHCLQPHGQESKSYVKDLTDFTNKVPTIDKITPEDILTYNLRLLTL